MAITFPDSPVLNESYTAENGLTYVWDGEKWSSRSAYNVDNNFYVQIDGGNSAIFTNATQVGINNTSPASTLDVTGDIEITGGSANGVILTSPNGTRFRLTINDAGVVTSTAI